MSGNSFLFKIAGSQTPSQVIIDIKNCDKESAPENNVDENAPHNNIRQVLLYQPAYKLTENLGNGSKGVTYIF